MIRRFDQACKHTHAADRAIARSEDVGPLHGVPVTIKERGSTRLPIGVQVVGPPWRDDTVRAVMDALERHFEQGDDYPTEPVTPA